MRLSLFGAPRLERDGEILPVQRRKILALLAYLAVSGHAHSRDTLATLLWPQNDQSGALANLRRDLSRLKIILHEDILIADRLLVELNPQAGLWVDTVHFRLLVEGAREHARTHGNNDLCGQCLEALKGAVEIYQGDFMEGFTLPDAPGFDEWQFFQAEELRRSLAEALQWLVRSYTTHREYKQAIPYARRWLALDPFHEAAHRQLMQLYAWSGEQAAAMRQFQECQRILQAELNIAPERETLELYEAIKMRKLALPDEVAMPQGSPALSQTIRFCTSRDGVRLAYAVVGQGAVLVKAANWLSHLEYDWNSPVWRHWLTGLGKNRTLIRYDERGCGLSDWNAKDFSLDAWVLDLETVVDAMKLERFPLLGISQGAPIAIAYAVRHPEKVSHLVLYGGYLRGRALRDPTPIQKAELDMFIQLIKIGWGQENPAFRQVFSMLFLPEGTPEQLNAFNELQRITTSPEIAARIVETFYYLDVRSLAPQVTQPTLVLHATNDLRIPFEEGRLMAATIPNARLVQLEGNNHILLESEPAWPRFLEEVNAFLQQE